jgi:PKD repeat protein
MAKKIMVYISVLFISCVWIYACANDTKHSGETVIKESTARIVANPAFGNAPLTVSFDASSFRYHYGSDTSLKWNFDDGGTSTEVTTEHTFKNRGTYIVSLSYKSSYGLQNTDWVVIIVN